MFEATAERIGEEGQSMGAGVSSRLDTTHERAGWIAQIESPPLASLFSPKQWRLQQTRS
jgi:hypothetical protein